MLAKNNEARQSERHGVHLHGHLHHEDRGVTIISFSATGCAFRTTAHLKKGDMVTLTVAVRPRPIDVEGEVIWTTEDYRIDTFYAYGIKFVQTMTQELIDSILDTDAQLSVQNGPLLHNKT